MIQNLILFTGQDDFRLQKRLKFYKKAFCEKYKNSETEYLNQNSSLKNLENTTTTPNLFGGKRLILLENFWNAEKFEQAEKSEFFKNLPNHTDTATIFAIEPNLDKRLKYSKFLLKNAKVETFEPMDETSLLNWIQDYAKTKNSTIAHQDAKLLLTRCGENLWNLSREIEKLATATEEKTITTQLITDLTIPHPTAIIWEFCENLSKKRTKQTIQTLHALLAAGQSIHTIFAMIIREIRIHAQLRSAIDQEIPHTQIATLTKLHPFVIQKTIPLTKNFSNKQIQNMYNTLFEIDKKIKTGGLSISTDDDSELALSIEKFIIQNCN